MKEPKINVQLDPERVMRIVGYLLTNTTAEVGAFTLRGANPAAYECPTHGRPKTVQASSPPCCGECGSRLVDPYLAHVLAHCADFGAAFGILAGVFITASMEGGYAQPELPRMIADMTQRLTPGVVQDEAKFMRAIASAKL